MITKCKLPKSIKIDKAKEICKLYSEGEYTIATCCEVVGVKYETFKQWAQPNLSEEDIALSNFRRGFVPDVHSLYKRALANKEVNYKALLRNAAREGLLKRASGIKYVETSTQAYIDEFGNSRGAVISKIEKYLPPDTTILIFLANFLSLFDPKDESNRGFIDDFRNKFKHLTNEQLYEKRLELESIK